MKIFGSLSRKIKYLKNDLKGNVVQIYKENLKNGSKVHFFRNVEYLCFFFGKVFLTFEKWTFLMSKNEKLRYFTPKKYSSLHNFKIWSKHKKKNFQVVTIIFFYFIKKSI